MVDVSLNKLVGAEALLRWRLNSGQYVSPSDFIPLAEHLGLIIPIGEWVLKTVCAFRKTLPHPKFYISVNLSPRQIQDKNIVETVLNTLNHFNMDPSDICVEITETYAAENLPDMRHKLEILKLNGLSLAMDDFGRWTFSSCCTKRPCRSHATGALVAKLLVGRGLLEELQVYSLLLLYIIYIIEPYIATQHLISDTDL